MPRPRRTAALTSTLLVSTALAVAACAGATGEPPSAGSPSSSSTSSRTSPTETSTSPTGTPTPDPYTIDCDLVTQRVVDRWTGDGRPAQVEAADDGCRIVSSDATGALIIAWRYLDVREDSGVVNDVSENSRPVEITEGLTAVRSESDVDPTRKTRLYVTFDNGRTLYAEATATLDRPRTMPELQKMTATIVTTYADQPPLPSAPVEDETSSTSS
ncbi:hypothetical protein [Janibacter alittae]|uniref:DUF3558 domain-containing protein n=1 Tax=Janibacter alittae TaxID=3115209 RepID=A0ABZ2MG46_9MICO